MRQRPGFQSAVQPLAKEWIVVGQFLFQLCSILLKF